MATKLYFIRHGETEWSLSRQHTGRTDIPLTEKGKQQAGGLEARLRPIPFHRVFTSPMQRARQTCALAGLAHVSEIEPDLSEWDYGDYEGLRTTEIRLSRPDWNIFRDGCPRGEAPADISNRADRLIKYLRAMDGNIALFSHGHFGCVLAARWIGLPIDEGPHFILGTASLSILGYDPDHPDVPGIILWNSPSDVGTDPAGDRAILDPAMKRRAIERWENEGGEIPASGRPTE